MTFFSMHMMLQRLDISSVFERRAYPPYGDPSHCGSFTGIRAAHTKAHFTRAVIEGVAFSLLDCKNYLLSKGIKLNEKAAIIGGSSSPLRRQIVTDALDMALVQYENSDSSLGSAVLAGIASNVFDGFEDDINKCIKKLLVQKPS